MAREVTRLVTGAKKDPGRRRQLNEDDIAVVEHSSNPQGLVLAQRKGCLNVLADGVGGHSAGEVASQLAVDVVPKVYYQDPSPNIRESLERAIGEANRQIYDRAVEVRSETGMASTIVLTVIRGDELHVAHVGDSRAYLVRGNRIRQLTTDHSWVTEQEAQGLLTAEEARTHPFQNYITRSLGTGPDVVAEWQQERICTGDVVVLCSDGLSGPVGSEAIKETVLSWEPAQACEELVWLANEMGGPDNISVIISRVDKVVPVPSNGVAISTGHVGCLADTQPRSVGRRSHRIKPTRRRTKVLRVLVEALLVISVILLLLTLRSQCQRLRIAESAVARLQLVVREYNSGHYGPANPDLSLELWQVVEDAYRGVRPDSLSSLVSAPASDPAVALEAPSIRIPTPTAELLRSTPVPTPWAEVLAKEGVIVRTGPGTMYESVGVARHGSRIAILGVHSLTGWPWFRVCCVGTAEEREGWVSADGLCLQLSVPREDIPELAFP